MAKFCSMCGSEIKSDSKFCSSCGASINSVDSVTPSISAQEVENSSLGKAGSEPKSKIAAGLLGIFLGSLGVHNFYLGFTGKAIAQLLITILSCGFLSPISYIWGLIEGILILTGSTKTDANGVNLVD